MGEGKEWKWGAKGGGSDGKVERGGKRKGANEGEEKARRSGRARQKRRKGKEEEGA